MLLHQSGAFHCHYTTLTFANQCVYILTSLFYKACSNHSRIELSAFLQCYYLFFILFLMHSSKQGDRVVNPTIRIEISLVLLIV